MQLVLESKARSSVRWESDSNFALGIASPKHTHGAESDFAVIQQNRQYQGLYKQCQDLEHTYSVLERYSNLQHSVCI